MDYAAGPVAQSSSNASLPPDMYTWKCKANWMSLNRRTANIEPDRSAAYLGKMGTFKQNTTNGCPCIHK